MRKSTVVLIVLFGTTLTLLFALVAVTISRESQPRSIQIYEPPISAATVLTVTVTEGEVITLPTGHWDVVDSNGQPMKQLFYDLGPRSNFLANLCTADNDENRCLVWVKDNPITATVSYR